MLPDGYRIQNGSRSRGRALLGKFMVETYGELYPEQKDFCHLGETVDKYYSRETPLWWVEVEETITPIALLWMGNAIDQITGDRYSHIFLLYVKPPYRRQGIAKALLEEAQTWAKKRGDRQLGLQVFPQNEAALALYQKLGFQTQSLLMLKRDIQYGHYKRT